MKIKARDIKGVHKCLTLLNDEKFNIIKKGIEYGLSYEDILLCISDDNFSIDESYMLLESFKNGLCRDDIILLLDVGHSPEVIYDVSTYNNLVNSLQMFSIIHYLIG